MTLNSSAHAREALRQQMLLRALWRANREAINLRGWLSGDAGAGLAAYRGNAGAVAERALAGAYPTVAALVGEESFAAMARAFWQTHPPTRGDLGEWGEALSAFIAASDQLASEPYLADSARLDFAVHRATRAADAAAIDPAALQRLAQHEPEHLRLVLTPGAALLPSRWPIVSIWRAHHAAKEGDRFAAVRAAFDAGAQESAFVHREGLAVRVSALPEPDAHFTAALLEGATLAAALDAAGGDFAFDRWLQQALAGGWIADLQALDNPAHPSS